MLNAHISHALLHNVNGYTGKLINENENKNERQKRRKKVNVLVPNACFVIVRCILYTLFVFCTFYFIYLSKLFDGRLIPIYLLIYSSTFALRSFGVWIKQSRNFKSNIRM